MPAPTTIVYLVDIEGDEFPISLPGQGYNDIAAYRNAMDVMQDLIRDGKMRPTPGPLTLGRVEDPADAN